MSSSICIPPRPVGEHDTVAAAGATGAARAEEGVLLAELVQRSGRGQHDAFAELYDKTSARVHGIVMRVLRSPDLAAEVTQEVFVEVWRQANRYSPDRGSVLGWMATIAHRRAVDRVRSASSSAARGRWFSPVEIRPDCDDAWSGVEQRLDEAQVRRALRDLTDLQRRAIVLAYYGGHSQTQIAALLGVPLGTVKTRIRDGLIRLRQTWGALGDEAPPPRSRLVGGHRDAVAAADGTPLGVAIS